MEVKQVKTGSAYEQRGSYSRAVQVGEFIFVSNTAGRDPATGDLPADAVEQTNMALDNIDRALKALGASLADVVKSCVYIQHRDDVYPVMDAYGARLRGIDPALTMYTPALASDDYRVEIEMTAHVGAGSARRSHIAL